MEQYLQELLTLSHSVEAKQMLRKGKKSLIANNSAQQIPKNRNYEGKCIQGKKYQSKQKSIGKDQRLSYEEKISNENRIKQSENLINHLKYRGLKATSDLEEEGVKIYEKKYGRLSNPLKINPTASFLKPSNFSRIQEKYQINKNYYTKEVQGAQNIQDFGFQPQMIEYIERRNRLMDLIKQNKNINKEQYITGQKPKLLYSRMGSQIRSTSTNSLPVLDRKPRKSFDNATTKSQFSNLGQSQRKSCPKICIPFSSSFKKAPFFAQVGKEQNNDIDIDKEIEQKTRQLFEKQQYERYKQDYIQIIRMKRDECRKNKYEKELLKNQTKLRQVIGAQ